MKHHDSKTKPEVSFSSIDIETDVLFADHPLQYSTAVASSLRKPPAIVSLTHDAPRPLETEDEYAIVMPLDGDLVVREAPYLDRVLRQDHMLFLPYFTNLSLHTLAKESSFLIFRFLPSIQLCAGRCPNKELCGVDLDHHRRSVASDTQLVSGTAYLQVNHPTDSWCQTVASYIRKGCTTLSLYEYKLREYFYILHNFYNRQEVDTFLENFHCRNVGFRAFVYRHHLDCRNVEELAQILGMSLSTFKRTFKEEFNCPPLQWMHKQKAVYIYRDLVAKELTLAEVAKKYHFSSVSYLCAFCKKMLNATPMKISGQKL